MEDFIINDRGAKIYFDISKHEKLYIPEISSDEENGKIYHVLSVGIHKSGSAMITIQEKGHVKAYRLPIELTNWAIDLTALSHEKEINYFPGDVEFGKLLDRFYAEIL